MSFYPSPSDLSGFSNLVLDAINVPGTRAGAGGQWVLASRCLLLHHMERRMPALDYLIDEVLNPFRHYQQQC